MELTTEVIAKVQQVAHYNRSRLRTLEAADVAQDTLIALWRMQLSEQPESPEAMAASITRKNVLRAAGKERRQKRDCGRSVGIEAAADVGSEEAGRIELFDLMTRLTDSHRAVLVARYLEGRTLAEIADAAGETVGQVANRIRQALKVARELAE